LYLLIHDLRGGSQVLADPALTAANAVPVSSARGLLLAKGVFSDFLIDSFIILLICRVSLLLLLEERLRVLNLHIEHLEHFIVHILLNHDFDFVASDSMKTQKIYIPTKCLV